MHNNELVWTACPPIGLATHWIATHRHKRHLPCIATQASLKDGTTVIPSAEKLLPSKNMEEVQHDLQYFVQTKLMLLMNVNGHTLASAKKK